MAKHRKRKIDIKIRTCYICLSHTANSSDALIIDNGSPWLNTYKFCFGVTMCLGDIPKQICGICRDKLQEYSDFKEVALRSEKLWKCVISANNTSIKFEKSNKSQMNVGLDKLKSDEDNHFNDDSATYVISDDEYDDSVNNTQDITLADNTTLKEQQSDTYEIMCYCGCTFDTEKTYYDHLDDCMKNTDKDLDIASQANDTEKQNNDHLNCIKIDTASLANDNVPKSTSYLKPKPLLKSKKALKRKVKSHQKETVERKRVKKNTDADTDAGVENDQKLIAVKTKKKIKPKKSGNVKNTLHDCGLCEETFGSVAELHQHLIDHSCTSDLRCLTCDFTGRDFADMLSHRLTHLANKHEARCHLCNKTFHSKYAHMWAAFHYRSKHLKEKGGWCSKCDKRFLDYRRWRLHEFYHENANGLPYNCDICGKGFMYRHGIVFHLRKHYKDYSCYCEICGSGFYLNCHLQSHIQLVHNDEKVKCRHCNKIYKNSLYLELHMKKVALEERYQCELCAKTFRIAYDLKEHQISHSDGKFKCEICGATFKWKQYYKIHMYKHAGYKKYKCDQCKGCFSTSNQLKSHLTVHTGVKRHKCNHCMRSYHGKKSLLQHIVKCH